MLFRATLSLALLALAGWNAWAVWNHVVVPDHGKWSTWAVICLSQPALYLFFVYLLWKARRDTAACPDGGGE